MYVPASCLTYLVISVARYFSNNSSLEIALFWLLIENEDNLL